MQGRARPSLHSTIGGRAHSGQSGANTGPACGRFNGRRETYNADGTRREVPIRGGFEIDSRAQDAWNAVEAKLDERGQSVTTGIDASTTQQINVGMADVYGAGLDGQPLAVGKGR